MRRTLLTAALLLGAAPALADETSGTVLSFDRVAGIIVLTDKTVYSLAALGDNPVQDLVAGDKVKIVNVSSGEDGITKISSIAKIAQ